MFELVGIVVAGIALALAVCVCFSAYYTFVKLPQLQRDILCRYSMCVVNQMALQYMDLFEEQQLCIAQEKIRTIFKDLHVVTPGDTVITSSLADALYRRKREAYCIRFDPIPTTPALEVA